MVKLKKLFNQTNQLKNQSIRNPSKTPKVLAQELLRAGWLSRK